VDLTGVALGGLIGLAGSLVAAAVALRINSANLKASEERRHEDLRREVYPQYLSVIDEAVDGVNAALESGVVIDNGVIVASTDWPQRLHYAAVMVDFLGSQDVSTEARALGGAMDHLVHFGQRTRGQFVREEPPLMSEEQMELFMIRAEVHARRIVFLNAAREDVGLAAVDFWEPRPPPSSLREWFPPLPDEAISLGWRDRLRPAWRLIPEGVRGPIRRRFPRLVQGPPT
jgi:hypothetical protein